MLNGLRRIAAVRREWMADRKRAVLAHLVSVEGSHYRRPGARMLLSEEGETFGSVSGGCLDGDLRRRIPEVVAGGESLLVRYDTGSRDDVVFGLGLGCGGKIEILLTPLGGGSSDGDPLDAAAHAPEGGVLATVVRSASSDARSGNQVFLSNGGGIAGGTAWPERLLQELRSALRGGAPSQTRGSRTRTLSDGTEVFLEVVAPPFALFLAGAGEDLAAVARAAAPLGWTVELVVPRLTAVAERRFAGLLAGPILAPGDLPSRATPRSAIVVATHNYLDDLETLRLSLGLPFAYVGLLGSRERAARLEADAADVGDASRVHGPAGLDIGAETPEEIAVSIVAEIQAVMAGRLGGPLRCRRAPIHDREAEGALGCSLAPSLRAVEAHSRKA